ncbi:MAG: acyloxyacyl hydrolase [Flavobacteriales bacterium]
MYFLFLLICTVSSLESFGQAHSDSARAYGIYVTGQYGFVFRHKPDMDHLITGHTPGMNVFLYRNYSGKLPWEINYGHPSGGVHFQALQLNNQVLGDAYAIMPFIRFPLNGIRKNPLRLIVSSGLGWLTRPFDIEDNHKNIAISSHINSAFHFELGYDYRFNDRLKAGIGLSLTHYSNGAWSVPNAGINLLCINAGLGWNIGRLEVKNKQRETNIDKQWNAWLWAGASGKEVYPVNRQSFFAGTIGLNVQRRMTFKSSVGTGLDLMYDHSLFDRMSRDQDNPTLDRALRIGTGIRYTLHIHKIEIPLEQMIYLMARYNPDTFLYHRVGIRYRINEHLISGVTLKAHFAKADYVEWHLGYKIF